ncbi:hypothetical protein JC794_05955 [Morganella morganii]|uniref:hypothetical protein n=1 Tax=Morganella morganii TaxID=582 RepID=UPI000D1E140A|nr:hypothetical protein [Morganella morganii]HAE78982.1 hypothetical protein [Morganella sp. (in: enterobacteria)]QXO43733.1 hypothetical protein CXB74_005685 [Morganella morganii]QXO47322.1 hypothetical protein JC862_05560 [Morganella morganii]QXO51102.1 hypothetical protein JC861_05670 [Morganella morganii]QXO54968.1 hypothetical protein JC830_05670 [Morganella morganii]
MKELNQEQLLSVSGTGFISAGVIFAGIAFDVSAAMISNITRSSEEIVFADHKDISRLRYEVI